MGWTALGAWYGLGDRTIGQLGADLFLNVAGGLIGSAIFLLAVVTEEELWKGQVDARGQRKTGYKFGVIGGIYSIVVMLGMYYAEGIFVQARKVDIRVAARPPMQLVAGRETPKKEGFNFGGIGEYGETNEIRVYYGQGLRWVWEAQGDQRNGKVLVAALGECGNIEQASKVAQRLGHIPSGPIRRVEVQSKSFPQDTVVRGRQTTVGVEADNLRTMWIGEEDEEGKRGLKEFLNGKHDLVASTEGSVEFFSHTITLQEGEGGKLEGVDVVWQVTLDDAVYEIRMPPRSSESEEENGKECKPVRTTHEEEDLLTEEVGLAGLYVQVEPIEPRQWGMRRLDGNWRFEKADGLVNFGQRTQGELNQVFRSKIDAIWLYDGVEDVYIDWTKVQVPVESRFRGHGDAWVGYSKEGRIITEGSFHASWLGGRRINQTTWESMSIELRWMLVTGILSALVAVGMIVYRRRKRWLEGWRVPLR